MLDDAQKDRLQDLFAEGIELPASQRAAFVRARCHGDPALGTELAGLLQVASDGLGGFLDEPLVAAPNCPKTVLRRGAGSRLDAAARPPELEDYEILEKVAAGGMGIVYRARQLRPIRREVAIKSIRAGMDTDVVLARFDAERQALARMAHPYIAAVHDAGSDADGRPFLAMEFVDGEPITDVCERHELSLEQRLDLFVKVCGAVEHAHRRGVLHRDLKPSNILVARHGDAWTPKVIDFGIAKALEAPLGERTLVTEQGGLLGTPEYMSPEQFDGPLAEPDTRTDVYALGVLFYELLAGAPPFDTAQLRAAGLLAMSSMIREQTPPKPSTRLRALTTANADHQNGTSRKQTTICGRWQKRLPGDLDWIAMKALEKDPDRRYGSPREFAFDISNHLQHLPVVAGPPSDLYRFRKFVRRYRAQVAAAALVLLSLAAGLAGTTWFLLEARDNAELAEDRATEARAAQQRADGIRIATDAAMLADESTDVALLLAVEASRLTDHDSVNRTIHEVLPRHRLQAPIEANDHAIRKLHYLPDGRLLTQPYDSETLLLAPDDARVLRRFAVHTDCVEDLSVNGDGTRFLTASRDGTAVLWSPDSSQPLLRVGRSGVHAERGVLDPAATRFAVGYSDGRIDLHDASNGALVRMLAPAVGERRVDAAFSADGKWVATSGQAAPLRICSASDGAPRTEIDLGLDDAVPERWMNSLDFTPDGDHLIFRIHSLFPPIEVGLATLDGEIRLREKASPALGSTHDGVFRASTETELLDVRIADAKVIARRPTGEMRALLAVSPDGSWGVGLDRKADLCTVDLPAPGDRNTPVRIDRLLGKSEKRGGYMYASFAPQGERFATGGDLARIWKRRGEFTPLELRVEGDPTVKSLAHADSSYVLLQRRSASPPTWELWDAASGKRRALIRAPGIDTLWIAPEADHLVGTQLLDPELHNSPIRRVVLLDLDGRPMEEHTIPDGGAHRIWPDGRAWIKLGEISVADAPANDGSANGGSVNDGSANDDPVGDAPNSWIYELPGNRLRASFRRWYGGVDIHRTALGDRITCRGLRGAPSQVFDAATGELLGRAYGDGELNHYGLSISPDTRRLTIVLGDLRARTYDLTRPDAEGVLPLLAEYTGLVRSNNYTSGFLDASQLVWVLCSNEVHLYEATTGTPFTKLQLDYDASQLVEIPERREFLTVTSKRRVQRWPLDPVKVARDLASGRLTARELERFEIDTPEGRDLRVETALRAVPKMRNFASLGERAFSSGDLDGAIASYRSGLALGRLAPQDQRRYRRIVELLCLRMVDADDGSAQFRADLDAAFEYLAEAVRCGAARDTVTAFAGSERLLQDPRFDELLPPR